MGGGAGAVAGAGGFPSVGLSPATGTGPAVFRGNLDAVGDGFVPGRPRSACWAARSRTRRCGHAATNGSKPACSTPVAEEALAAYDRIVGFDLTEVAVDGSAHKRPAVAPVPAETLLTGGNPVGSGPCCVTAPASRWVGAPTAPTATTRFCSPPPSTRQPTAACSPTSRPCTSTAAMTAAPFGPAPPTGASTTSSAARRRPRGTAQHKTTTPLGMRWPVERTNSWLSNFGQLRRNTDRHPQHRLAQLALAIVLLITAKLIDWRNRWNPPSGPIR